MTTTQQLRDRLIPLGYTVKFKRKLRIFQPYYQGNAVGKPALYLSLGWINAKTHHVSITKPLPVLDKKHQTCDEYCKAREVEFSHNTSSFISRRTK